MIYSMLDWDSRFFNINVASITDSNLVEDELTTVIAELKYKGVGLVYWASKKQIQPEYIKELGGACRYKNNIYIRSNKFG